jgi:hypothetical protein
LTDALSVGELMSTIELDGNEARGTFDRFYEWIQARRSASFQLVVGAFLAAVGALVVAVIQNQLATDPESQAAFLLATALLGLVGLLRYRSLARAPSDYLAQLAALKFLQKLRE